MKNLLKIVIVYDNKMCDMFHVWTIIMNFFIETLVFNQIAKTVPSTKYKEKLTKVTASPSIFFFSKSHLNLSNLQNIIYFQNFYSFNSN